MINGLFIELTIILVVLLGMILYELKTIARDIHNIAINLSNIPSFDVISMPPPPLPKEVKPGSEMSGNYR